VTLVKIFLREDYCLSFYFFRLSDSNFFFDLVKQLLRKRVEESACNELRSTVTGVVMRQIASRVPVAGSLIVIHEGSLGLNRELSLEVF
jgi:hypothetical protein